MKKLIIALSFLILSTQSVNAAEGHVSISVDFVVSNRLHVKITGDAAIQISQQLTESKVTFTRYSDGNGDLVQDGFKGVRCVKPRNQEPFYCHMAIGGSEVID